MRTPISKLFLLIVAVSLTACNTFAGIGRDLQKSGEYIEKAAK